MNDWHRADIVAAVKKTGKSLARLSLEHGLKENTVKTALHRPYHEGERIIAEAIGKKPEEIWPSRYNKDGSWKRRSRRTRRQMSSTAGVAPAS